MSYELGVLCRNTTLNTCLEVPNVQTTFHNLETRWDRRHADSPAASRESATRPAVAESDSTTSNPTSSAVPEGTTEQESTQAAAEQPAASSGTISDRDLREGELTTISLSHPSSYKRFFSLAPLHGTLNPESPLEGAFRCLWMHQHDTARCYSASSQLHAMRTAGGAGDAIAVVGLEGDLVREIDAPRRAARDCPLGPPLKGRVWLKHQTTGAGLSQYGCHCSSLCHAIAMLSPCETAVRFWMSTASEYKIKAHQPVHRHQLHARLQDSVCRGLLQTSLLFVQTA